MIPLTLAILPAAGNIGNTGGGLMVVLVTLMANIAFSSIKDRLATQATLMVTLMANIAFSNT